MFIRWFRRAPAKSVMELHRATGLSVRLCKQILERAAPELHSKLVEAMKSQTGTTLFHDPLEDDPQFKPAIDAAHAAADAELADAPREFGFCHRFWAVKKRILEDEHGLVWLTPQEMNPGSRFD